MRPSFATRLNLNLLEENYERWQENPRAVDSSWAAFFEGFELGEFEPTNGAAAVAPAESPLQTRVDGLVYAYRTLGHTIANVNPLADTRPTNPLLLLRELGFSEKDLDAQVSSRFFYDGRSMSLRDMIRTLENLYADTIGAEFQHIQDTRMRNWVRHRFETRKPKSAATREEQMSLLRALMEAEAFEVFLHTNYVGQKRFSLQGAEGLIAILDVLLAKCPSAGVEEICMGMAHRGRLNVLANVLRKSLDVIFAEFTENYVPKLVEGDGDVKYHLGYRTVRKLRGGSQVEIRLAANPSHLEAVDPVVEGTARARQRIRGDTETRRKVVPLLIHGDAAVIGQGIVMETLNMSQLPGYSTGGTIHLIVNNQIGFTTLPEDARSSRYCTDVAKMLEVPILHVNGEDPLALKFATEMALDFRQEFGRDFMIDMYCYRKYGHQEVDEPSFTQPDLYARLEKRPSIAQSYERELLERGVLDEEDLASLETEMQLRLEMPLDVVKANGQFSESTAVFQPKYAHESKPTAISDEMLRQMVDRLTTPPPDFNLLPKTKRIAFDQRRKVFEAGGPYDWGFAEALAFGSLLLEGTPVRLSGQDSRRGTFGQRHAVIYDRHTGKPYIPLMHLAEKQARLCIYNSPLSENAVLGFDYGYSLDFPNLLCLWEAQFGDFANGAQVVIDQFIVSAESKWQRPSGIVLLLPHGYEGQGPEHSSARLERFLQACAEDNIQVCNLTTCAQYFHVLRRQMKRDFVKPLVIMTPKSLLRLEAAGSRTEDFTGGKFREVIADPDVQNAERVILCSGKVYYDLANHRAEQKITNTALVRVEQLYPFCDEQVRDAVGKATKIVWCQEEPQNMGAWSFIEPRLRKLFGRDIAYAGRDAGASPAVGALALHKREQAALIRDAFSL
jgi:2-oxoglutarate dehydrogenase E1 component